MSTATTQGEKVKLFFIKSPQHNFNAVETYLKKRNFEVIVESNIKEALTKIISNEPQYIFLAWDHPNDQIRSIHKMIYQTSLAPIIPYIMSTQRDQIIQLEASGFEHRLYPPLSGPAIQRVLSKYEKKNNELDQAFKQADNTKSNESQVAYKPSENTKKKERESQMIQVKSFFKDNDMPDAPQAKPNNELSAKAMKEYADRARSKYKAFNHTEENELPKIKYADEKKSNMMNFQSGENSPESETDFNLFKKTKPLEEKQKEALSSIFANSTHPNLLDVFETTQGLTPDNEKVQKTQKIHVMVIDETKWTGYLVVSSEEHIDQDSAYYILNDWVSKMIKQDNNEVPDIYDFDKPQEYVCFTLETQVFDFDAFSAHRADLFKEVEHQGRRTKLSFFSYSPFDVLGTIHDEYDYFKIPTEILTVRSSFEFNIYVFLKENRKFVLYYKADSTIDPVKFDKLMQKKADYVYCTFDYERQVLKYRAEYNIAYAINKFLEKMKNPEQT